ncbi:MAG: hypothetical protein Q8904_08935 [Bacteroidota bacterium]|nr:hypothetical protein [Bacteroidota bacterium]
MKKISPLLLLLSCLNINGQKSNDSGLKSDSLLNLLSEDEKLRYIRITYKWMYLQKGFLKATEKTKLSPIHSTTRLNKTGKLKTLVLPSRLKLTMIFVRYALTGLLPMTPVSFSGNSSLFPCHQQLHILSYQNIKATIIEELFIALTLTFFEYNHANQYTY